MLPQSKHLSPYPSSSFNYDLPFILNSTTQLLTQNTSKLLQHKQLHSLQKHELNLLFQDFTKAESKFLRSKESLLHSPSNSVPKVFSDFLNLPSTSIYDSILKTLFTFNFQELTDEKIEKFFPIWKKNNPSKDLKFLEFIVISIEAKMKLDLFLANKEKLQKTSEKIQDLQEIIKNLNIKLEEIQDFLLSSTKDEEDLCLQSLIKPELFQSEDLYGSEPELTSSSTILFQSDSNPCSCSCFLF